MLLAGTSLSTPASARPTAAAGPAAPPAAPPSAVAGQIAAPAAAPQLHAAVASPSASPSATLATTPAATGGIANNPLVVYNWNPSTQLSHFLAAEQAVQNGTAGARAKIIAIGDSTTAGFGGTPTDTNYRGTASYPVALAAHLTQDGAAAQSDNFLGGGQNVDGRIALVGTGYWSGAYGAGAQAIETGAPGDGAVFTLNAPASYDHVDVDYLDDGTGVLNVSVDGGPVIGSVQFGNTGQTLTRTFALPAGSHSKLTLTAQNATPVYIEGASFWNSAKPSIEVLNAGEGGATSAVVGDGSTTGFGEIPGSVEVQPNLVLINYGINDILNGTITAAQTAANIALMVRDFRAVGADPVVIVPTPFESANYAAGLPALRAAEQALSNSLNVPLIDLSATYGDNWQALSDAGLISDYAHPNAALYDIIGAQFAALLTKGTAPVVNLAGGPLVTNGSGSVSLGTAVAGAGGGSLAVKLTSDAQYPSGSAVTLSGGTLTYSAGPISPALARAGADVISYSVTDGVTGVTTEETQSVTVNNAPCFAAGTRIRTEHGWTCVEDLAAGDQAATLSGRLRPVAWIGFRRVDLTTHPRPGLVMPVRVRAGAFGPAVPERDLILSPDHAVFVDGRLVPIRRLMNGGTIATEPRDSVTYYHVELDAHDVLLAEGLPAESYLDTGNRSMFANGGASVALHADFDGARSGAARCAPMATDSRAVERIWSRLALRSAERGYTPAIPASSTDPALLLTASGREVGPVLTGPRGRYVFALPPGAGRVRIGSRAADPSQLRPWLDDRRRLGVCVERILVRQDDEMRELSVDDPALEAGWHAVERDGGRQWRWTDGGAWLRAPDGAQAIELVLAGPHEYPMDGAAERRPRRAARAQDAAAAVSNRSSAVRPAPGRGGSKASCE